MVRNVEFPGKWLDLRAISLMLSNNSILDLILAILGFLGHLLVV